MIFGGAFEQHQDGAIGYATSFGPTKPLDPHYSVMLFWAVGFWG
jgi:hypothetical protein